MRTAIMEEIDYLGETIYRWQHGPSTFLAAPTRGARLMNWNLAFADGSFRDIIHWPDLESIDQLVKARGGNPILFPFSARTFHEGEIHKWKDPKGEIRPMPMHGIARQGEFEIVRIDKTGFAARLLPTEEDQEAYPYDYDFEVVYRFQERELSVEFRLTNEDAHPIPWSAGHHFYFAMPWVEGTKRSDYQVKIPAKQAVRQKPDGSLYPVEGFKKSTKLDQPDLVDRIHYQLTNPLVECVCQDEESKLEIEIGTTAKPNPGYTVVTWTESDKSPFFCIEPWMGPPNSPEHKIGYHLVPPGETDAFSVTIRV